MVIGNNFVDKHPIGRTEPMHGKEAIECIATRNHVRNPCWRNWNLTCVNVLIIGAPAWVDKILNYWAKIIPIIYEGQVWYNADLMIIVHMIKEFEISPNGLTTVNAATNTILQHLYVNHYHQLVASHLYAYILPGVQEYNLPFCALTILYVLIELAFVLEVVYYIHEAFTQSCRAHPAATCKWPLHVKRRVK